MVKLWAEKEFRNLKILALAGIPCPEVLFLKSHVLVMTLIGDKNGWYKKSRALINENIIYLGLHQD